jgi:hypothetical protein
MEKTKITTALCRGQEISHPQSDGQCPIEYFEMNKNLSDYKTWTRVCTKHQIVKVDKNRVFRFYLPELTKFDHEEGRKHVSKSILKRFSKEIKKFEVIVKQVEKHLDVPQQVEPSGEVYCVLKSADLMDSVLHLFSTYHPSLKFQKVKKDVIFFQCNAHKRVCIENNFLSPYSYNKLHSSTSCTVGKIKHHNRSIKSRIKRISGSEAGSELKKVSTKKKLKRRGNSSTNNVIPAGAANSVATTSTTKTATNAIIGPSTISKHDLNQRFNPNGLDSVLPDKANDFSSLEAYLDEVEAILQVTGNTNDNKPNKRRKSSHTSASLQSSELLSSNNHNNHSLHFSGNAVSSKILVSTATQVLVEITDVKMKLLDYVSDFVTKSFHKIDEFKFTSYWNWAFSVVGKLSFDSSKGYHGELVWLQSIQSTFNSALIGLQSIYGKQAFHIPPEIALYALKLPLTDKQKRRDAIEAWASKRIDNLRELAFILNAYIANVEARESSIFCNQGSNIYFGAVGSKLPSYEKNDTTTTSTSSSNENLQQQSSARSIKMNIVRDHVDIPLTDESMCTTSTESIEASPIRPMPFTAATAVSCTEDNNLLLSCHSNSIDVPTTSYSETFDDFFPSNVDCFPSTSSMIIRNNSSMIVGVDNEADMNNEDENLKHFLDGQYGDDDNGEDAIEQADWANLDEDLKNM